MSFECRTQGIEAMIIRGTEGVVEVELLLTACQLAVLEQAARERATTPGQLVRQLIRNFVAGVDHSHPTPAGSRLGEER